MDEHFDYWSKYDGALAVIDLCTNWSLLLVYVHSMALFFALHFADSFIHLGNMELLVALF